MKPNTPPTGLPNPYRGLAEQGLYVVVAGRNEYSVDRVVSELTKDGLAASGHQLDVNDPASVARAFADTAKRHGRLDVLVNNAGIAIDRGQVAASPDFSRPNWRALASWSTHAPRDV